MNIRRSALAEDDLIKIWLYVATENPDAADRLLDRLERRTRLLATQPFFEVLRGMISARAYAKWWPAIICCSTVSKATTS